MRVRPELSPDSIKKNRLPGNRGRNVLAEFGENRFINTAYGALAIKIVMRMRRKAEHYFYHVALLLQIGHSGPLDHKKFGNNPSIIDKDTVD